MTASSDGVVGNHDKTALDEIDLTGELMIAATASPAERLATEQIDEVLLERGEADHAQPPGRPGF